MISALTGSGCDDLLDYLAAALPEGPWFYPEDQISDLPMRQLAAEITREKLYLRLHQELPYASHVETESWEEKKDGSVRIEQVIYVERESQKKIVLGHKGETIRAIGQAAREEMARDPRDSRSICSCSSRCARTGATTPSATARWGWSFRAGAEAGRPAADLAGGSLARQARRPAVSPSARPPRATGRAALPSRFRAPAPRA